MAIEKTVYGPLPDGRQVHLYTISGAGGAAVMLSDFGARVNGILVPDKAGALADVALGFASPGDNLAGGRYFGAVCGRYANRIRNAEFVLNGKTYKLAANDDKNSLHGGAEGYDVRLWNTKVLDDSSIEFSLHSPDGDEGYPGNLMVRVVYTFTADNVLRIAYHAVCDADTIINLTNHAYFNLAGHAAGPVAAHILEIEADYYTPVNDAILPMGAVTPVAGTVFDFTNPTTLGLRADADDPQLKAAGGYDHNFVLKKTGRGLLEKAVTATEPVSGRVMEVWTTKPGVQLYGGNFMNGIPGKEGAVYGRREGFCLETQYFPNAVEVTHFPSPVLRAGEIYSHTTEYRFTTTA
ncbi:galactose mutarotase [Ruminococcaceae bacterium OttesenSCG-928-D13]|nr:galactose mutarotase [Ruminococcaceae bacterium OttesenSCG-928-D13]